MSGKAKKVDPNKAEKVRQAMELRKHGASWDQIAKALGWANKSGPYKAVAKVLAQNQREDADAFRTLQASRLDEMHRAAYAKALKGDLRAALVVIKIMERHAKLFGYDQPVRVEHSGPDGDPVKVFSVNMDAESAMKLSSEMRQRILEGDERAIEAIAALGEVEDDPGSTPGDSGGRTRPRPRAH